MEDGKTIRTKFGRPLVDDGICRFCQKKIETEPYYGPLGSRFGFVIGDAGPFCNEECARLCAVNAGK